MPPVFGSAAPPSGAVLDDHGSSAMWTGNKRRRTTSGPSSADTKEDQVVFSADDDIDEHELSRYHQELKSRERPFYVQIARSLDDQGTEEVYRRLCALRFRHYKMLQEGSLNLDTTASVPLSDYPDEVFKWDYPFEPCLSIYGWTHDPQFFDLEDLDDYQRIVPTRADLREYVDWEKYRLAFSTYEIDEEYVKYWDQLSEKMRWVEDTLLLLDREQFSRYDYRGARQAIKIAAAGFCHLPASLAALGYEEYVLGLRYHIDRRKGYDQVYFEVWKRVSKQEMSFNEALEDVVSTGMKLSSSCLRRIQAQFKGLRLLEHDFNICMGHIRELGEGTVLKRHFTDAVYSKITIPKLYVDYAKKKLEVARLLHLNPGMGRSQRIENDQSPKV